MLIISIDFFEHHHILTTEQTQRIYETLLSFYIDTFFFRDIVEFGLPLKSLRYTLLRNYFNIHGQSAIPSKNNIYSHIFYGKILILNPSPFSKTVVESLHL